MFRFITAGESHGPRLTAIIEGIPAGLQIDVQKINEELAKRQQGFGRGGRMKIEKDRVTVLSGIRFGQTLGSPITLSIENKDWPNWEKRMSALEIPAAEPVVAARPGHADLPGVLKYERSDIRDILERASARETAARVAVGAVAKQLLQACGMQLFSHVISIGGAACRDESGHLTAANQPPSGFELGCIDKTAEAAMMDKISQAKQQGDTLGGIFEIVIRHVLPGLGSYVHWDRRLDGKMAAALMSIPAIKGVEIGDGFKYAELPGSQAHDEIYYDSSAGYYRKTNHAGGIEGGMSNGEPIVVRAVMKPIPTLMKPLNSVDISTKQAVQANTERSDVCAVSAAAVVGEAMAAIVIAELLLEKFGGDSIQDFLAAIAHYRQRIHMP
jgi:chorismate synthase